MKGSVGTVFALILWAFLAQIHVLANPPGPGSSVPVSPDDTPLLTPSKNLSPNITGFSAGTPGPFLPNANDPTKFSPTYPSSGVFPSPLAAEP